MNNEDIVLEGTMAPGMPTPEEEFKRVTGEDFDPERYSIEWSGAENYGEDNTYTPYRIVRKQVEKENDNTPTVEPDEEVIVEGTVAPGMPTPEEEFKRVTGEDFDPERYSIEWSGAENYGEDDTYTPYRIVRKQVENTNSDNNSGDNSGSNSDNSSSPFDFSDWTEEDLNKRIAEIRAQGGNFSDELDNDDPLVREHDAILAELDRRAKEKENKKPEFDFSDWTEEDLNKRIAEIRAQGGNFSGELDNDDPLVREHDAILAELDRRAKEKENKKTGFDFSDWTEEDLNKRIAEIRAQGGNFSDELDNDDPLVREHDAILAELDRRAKEKENKKTGFDFSDWTDEDLNKRIAEIRAQGGNFSDELDNDDPLVREHDAILAELDRRAKEKENKKPEFDFSDWTDEDLNKRIAEIRAQGGNFSDELDNDDPLVREHDAILAELDRRAKEKEKDKDKEKDNGWKVGGYVDYELPGSIKLVPTPPGPQPKPNPQPGPQPQPNPQPVQDDTVKVTFMNGGLLIPGYDNIVITKGDTIKHGPVIDPVPLNKKGKPKKITAQVFSHWEDQYGNVVDFSKPITSDVILTAKYKFDTKKAIAVGLGAAVGGLAFAADLAVPMAMPIVSMVGATGFGIASRIVKKKLTNITASNVSDAQQITAIDDIPPELAANISKQKKTGYISTWCKTSAVACTISAAAHTIRNFVNSVQAQKTNANPETTKADPAKTNPTNTDPTKTNPDTNPIKTNPDTNPIKTNPDTNPITRDTGNPITTPEPKTETVQVLKGYSPDGEVYKSASDALAGTNGDIPYKPAFNGPETFEAYYNGTSAPITRGEELAEIMKSVGASNPSDVAVNVMNADGVPLTWESLTNLTETVSKTI